MSEHVELGQAQTCYGDEGDIIYVFWWAAKTSYTVNIRSNVCCRAGEKSPTIMTLPNENNLGSGSICGRNEQCHGKGHAYWNNSMCHCPPLHRVLLTNVKCFSGATNGGVIMVGGLQEWPFGNAFAGIVPDLDEMP